MNRSLSKMWVAVLIFVGACAIIEPEPERIVTMYVAPNRAMCFGPWEMQCLVTREESTPQWGFFYAHIEGFTYEPGFRYVLRVGIRPIPNPPADGSSLGYRLIQLISKEPCAATFMVDGANPEPPEWDGC